MSARIFVLAALPAIMSAEPRSLADAVAEDRAAPTPRVTAEAVATPASQPGVRAEARSDGERTAFSAAFPDPDSDMRAAGVGFLLGYILVIEARPPGASAETFASPLLAPAVGVPEPGHVCVGFVEPRVWPAGTSFLVAVHDRDGNLL